MKTKIIAIAVLISSSAGVMALPAIAASTGSTAAINSTCVVSALSKRDTAISSGMDVYVAAMKADLSVRTNALTAAWNLSGKDRKIAITAAWNTYKSSLKTERKKFNDSVKAAWQVYFSDRKNCGSGAASEDTTTQGVDATL
jgi:hypothetical protein